tara:strand:+ start:2372 stop:3466 length:1095 start_codon:yes stop_codon:yes gene_type:complete
MVIIAGLFILYLCLMLVAISGFTRTIKPSKSCGSDSFITLIIPYRNEENRIQNLLISLESQKDISSVSKIIFVDDHSTDSSRKYINNWISKQSLSCESLFLNQNYGKKRAIDLGVQKSSSEFVMIMDADVSFNDVYFDSIKKNIDLSHDLYLTSLIETNGVVWSRILSCSISVISLGLANLGIPILANGAGLIFRRKSYNELNPFYSNFNISSGDDMYLLNSFYSNNKSVKTLFNNNLVIKTQGSGDIQDLIERSLRWSGKMKMKGLLVTKLVGLLVVLCNLLIFPIIAISIYNFQWLFLSLLLFKLLPDLLVLITGSFFYKENYLLKYSLPMFFLYPLILLLIIFLQAIKYKVKWKDRELLNI